jgi:hypothetical protein
LARVSEDELILPRAVVAPLELVDEYASTANREHELVLGYVCLLESEVTFHLPSGYEVVSMPEPVKTEQPFATYELSFEKLAHGFKVRRRFVLREARIAVEDYEKFRKLCLSCDRVEESEVVMRKKRGK